MGIPLYIFYFIYLALVAVFLLFTFFNAYHLVKFGLPTLINIFILIFFLAVSLAIIYVSWEYISLINWQQMIYLNFFDYRATF